MDNTEKESCLAALLENGNTSEEQKKRAMALIESDPTFRDTYRAMAMVRSALRTAPALHTPTPDAVRSSIMVALQQETSPPAQAASHQTISRATLFSRRRMVIIGMALAAILAYVTFSLLLRPPSAPTAGIAYLHINEENYREQAWHNFAAIKGHTLSLHKATSSFAELEKFFREHGVNYYLIPPEFPSELLGGVISEHNGQTMAHIVFRHDTTLIYMFQAPRSAFTNHTIEVENTVLHIVDNGAWYWEESQQNGTLAIWEKGSTVCALVANLPPKSFQSLLQSKG